MKKLFFLFACALIVSSANARAQSTDAACSPHGVNLIDGLDKKEPKLWSELQAEAEEMPNHKGIFWKIEKDGLEPSYLFGTIHLSDPRVMALPGAVTKAYDDADKIVVEATDIVDQKAFLRVKVEQPDLIQFTDGSTLQSHLPQDRLEEIDKKLEARGIILGAVGKMKPWIITSLLALPKCERQRKLEGADFLDGYLITEAQDQGRTVIGLESAVEQLEAMNRLPLDFHIRNLISAAQYGDSIEDAMETTIALYLQGEIGMIMPALRKIVPDSLSKEDYDLFQKVLLTDRNHIMAQRVAPVLATGDAFIAVGALHLPGKEGLVELLRAQGYRLTAM
ncbi:hypothetical protein Brsp04_03103 [Brucella sp. NBRC 12952]|uniref:Polysaccharide biosynthesis protein GumN n=1 Tax=Brucella pseudogrignonensis TaxID=419475 RepID=A0A256GM19_9HYPH|nr:TraB/GumN family protein [Brucella pseudogrignonensis]EMG55716.1 GumN family protein [Ochrobactrum sp. CDB2]NNV21624.1 polysaccharide biosynthesis protein GumN [Brucella pseudogrignonensis]OYR28194.1 traB family protein [Brucella pseudogrignonensis]